jgi:hypothetical protein
MYGRSCEEAIWQSEMGRKGVAGDVAKHMEPDMSNSFQFYSK